ncbi:hypothetical protein [Humidesulfovibrio idahonensis]
MIVCTGCGTRNADAAQNCATCGRKLQSRWAVGAPAPDGNGALGAAGGPAANAAGGGADAWPVPGSAASPLDLDALGGRAGLSPTGMDGGAWESLAPAQHTLDPHASRLVRACAETWTYALMLVAGAVTTAILEDWRYLAGAIVVAGGLAWARKI